MINQIEKNKFYTVIEVAEFLEITTQTVSKYLRKGTLTGEKRGPKEKWYVLGKEIIKLQKKWNMIKI